MNRLTILVDIASRAMLSTIGSPRTVAGAVAIDTSAIYDIRAEASRLPKWGDCTPDNAAHAVDLLTSQAVSVAIVSLNRETDAWQRFIKDANILHEAIILDSKLVAGWAKAANLLKFVLLSSACAAATGHAIGADRRPRIVSPQGYQLVECATICDNEIEGKENLEIFKSLWGEQHIPKAKLARLGVQMISESVAVTTDDEEPCLLLADYAAGLGLASVLDAPGRLPLPVTQHRAKDLLLILKSRNKLVFQEEDFDSSYDEIFKDVMAKARELGDR